MTRRALGAVLVLAGVPAPLAAQGLPFHTETALTTAFAQRGVRAFGTVVHRGSVTTVVAPLVVLPLAPHERVTTMVVVPVVVRRMWAPGAGDGGLLSIGGLGDLTIGAKWAFFVRDRPGGTNRLAVLGVVRLPTGETNATFRDGTPAPPPLQLGAGAVGAALTLVGTLVRGRVGLTADVGHSRTASADGFRHGATTRYDVALGFRIPGYIATVRTQTVQLYLEWNGTITVHDRVDDVNVTDSGGHVGFVSPGVQWVPLPQLLVEASLQVPVLEDLHGAQPGVGVRPAFGARVLF